MGILDILKLNSFFSAKFIYMEGALEKYCALKQTKKLNKHLCPRNVFLQEFLAYSMKQ